jgi:hypothetical protein
MPSSRTDEERLHLFSQRVQALAERRGFRDKTLWAGWSMRGNAEQTEFLFDLGDEDDLRAVLPAFRQFTAPGEDVHLLRVFNILHRVLVDTSLREANVQNRAAWKQAEKGEMLIAMTLGDRSHTLGARDCFDLWVNAEVFHADHEKERLYNQLPDFVQATVVTQATRFVLLGSKIVHFTRNIVDQHLGIDARGG